MFTRETKWLRPWPAAAGVAACLLAWAPLPIAAQTLTNPDISAIGDMRYLFRDNVAANLANQNNTSFEFEELELNFASYLNPYARADVYLSIHGVEGPVEVEEVYSTILRGLPVQVRFGKYFLDIGKLNSEHVHQWAWANYPLMLQSFFGPEGAQAIGLNLRRLLSIGETAVTVSLNAFRSDLFGGHEEEGTEGGEENGGGGKSKIGYSGRVSAFRELNDTNFIEAGGSYLYAQPDFEHDLQAQVAAVDLTYKWRPDIYRGVKVRAEMMISNRDVEEQTTGAVNTVSAAGAFASAQIKFRRRFDCGGFVDWSEDALVDDMSTTAFGTFLAFMPAEETARYSLIYRYETSDFFEGTSNSINFQVLWSLGPHKPHPF